MIEQQRWLQQVSARSTEKATEYDAQGRRAAIGILIPLDLKLVSVKLAGFSFALPTFSLVFYKINHYIVISQELFPFLRGDKIQQSALSRYLKVLLFLLLFPNTRPHYIVINRKLPMILS